jgi:hypothetical protein
MAVPEQPQMPERPLDTTAGRSRRARGVGWWSRALVLTVVGFAVVGFAVIQFVPYGRDHTNPPVVAEPSWDSPRTAQLAKAACYDCHSNSSVWPWYSNVAPASWLVQKDVDEARARMNFSDPAKWNGRGRSAARAVASGQMPPSQYTLIHRNANLSPAERQELANGLTNSLTAR